MKINYNQNDSSCVLLLRQMEGRKEKLKRPRGRQELMKYRMIQILMPRLGKILGNRMIGGRKHRIE